MDYRLLPQKSGPTLLFRQWKPSTSSAERAVFLGHSQPTHSGMLGPLAEGFQRQGWHVFSGDVRGHGRSTDDAHILGHLPAKSGWQDAVADMRHFLEKSFEHIAWENRMVVVPNITALLTLEVMKDWPDLAKHIVLISPPPNQKTLALFGKAFALARMRMRKPDAPDEQPLHHLYAFLGSHLKDRNHPADVMSSDRALIQKVVNDPYGWPIPTPAYWSNIFEGMLSAWRWPKDAKMKPGTRCLMMFGGEDAMLRDGGFLAPIERFLHQIGIDDVASERVNGARSALFLEEDKYQISQRVLDWAEGTHRPQADHEEMAVADLASSMITHMGTAQNTELGASELVELCYNAIDDESRWTEVIYRMIYDAELEGDVSEEDMQARISQLMPHWERAFTLNQQVMMNATLGILLQTVVEKLQIGVAILDRDGELLHANETYRSLLNHLFPDLVAQGNQDGYDHRATRLLLASANDEEAGKDRVIIFQEKPVGFQFYPPALHQTGLQRKKPASILIARSGAQAGEISSDKKVLAELAYGLTGKEAEIALGVAAGQSLDEIAEQLGIYVSTVRGHLKKSFQKVGVHSQAELSARLMSGPIGWLK